jgi:hypothetical protein
MINKNCPLIDKHKLDAVLHGKCLWQNVLPKRVHCYDCPYESPTLIEQLERALVHTSRQFLFEPIDTTLKQKIKDACDNTLQNFFSTKRIEHYKVTCDNTNYPDRIEINAIIRPTNKVEYFQISLKL